MLIKRARRVQGVKGSEVGYPGVFTRSTGGQESDRNQLDQESYYGYIKQTGSTLNLVHGIKYSYKTA